MANRFQSLREAYMDSEQEKRNAARRAEESHREVATKVRHWLKTLVLPACIDARNQFEPAAIVIQVDDETERSAPYVSLRILPRDGGRANGEPLFFTGDIKGLEARFDAAFAFPYHTSALPMGPSRDWAESAIEAFLRAQLEF